MKYTITYYTIKEYGFGGKIATDCTNTLRYWNDDTIITDNQYLIKVNNIVEISIHS